MNRNCSPSAIGRRIADLRREVGLTQGELAEKADISVVHLSNIELGKKNAGVVHTHPHCRGARCGNRLDSAGKYTRHIRRGERENRRVACRLHE